MKTVLAAIIALLVGGAGGYAIATKRLATHGPVVNFGTAAAPLFELDGKVYTDADLTTELKSSLYEARSEGREREEGALTEYALRLALAKEKDPAVKPESMPALTDLVPVDAPTEDDVKKIFDNNKEKLPPGVGFDQVKAEIEGYVKKQRVQAVLSAKLAEFRGKNRFKVLLPALEAPKVDLDLAAYPARGASTSVVLVEVSDYLCPHCQAVQPEIDQALKDVGAKFKFVQVPYSLRPTELSGTLARGAICANDLGVDAFWKYHEAGFKLVKEKGWKSGDPDDVALAKEVATTAGVDAQKVEDCVKDPKTKERLDKIVDAMQKAGVGGTPTFFLNGRKVEIGPKSLRQVLDEAINSPAH